VQAEEWHPEQKTTLHKDGSYTLELLGDILLYGSDVEVIGPKVLRDKLLASVRKTLANYER
jgi:predicted DNA-binding transcriptional regulator YafY